MLDPKITLEAAEFLDTRPEKTLDVEPTAIREIVQRFLQCAFDDVGKAPHLIDG